jgi:hypothetical protein
MVPQSWVMPLASSCAGLRAWASTTITWQQAVFVVDIEREQHDRNGSLPFLIVCDGFELPVSGYLPTPSESRNARLQYRRKPVDRFTSLHSPHGK